MATYSLILAVIVSIKLPVLSFHRFLFILPAFYLCLSLGLNQLIKPFQSILTTLFLVFNLITSGIYLFNSRHHRENWQALARQLIARNTTQAPVAVLAPVKTPLTYYYAGDIINYTDITSDFNQPEVWLVPYAEPLFDPKLTTKQTLNQLGFKEKYQKHFRGDLILIQYTNENWN